jgi:hypothetical protein
MPTRRSVMVDVHEATTWITAGKSALDLFRSAWKLLPSDKAKEEIGAKLAEAETALSLSDAKLAKELGYGICYCKYPPSIMLWKERERVHECSNPE